MLGDCLASGPPTWRVFEELPLSFPAHTHSHSPIAWLGCLLQNMKMKSHIRSGGTGAGMTPGCKGRALSCWVVGIGPCNLGISASALWLLAFDIAATDPATMGQYNPTIHFQALHWGPECCHESGMLVGRRSKQRQDRTGQDGVMHTVGSIPSYNKVEIKRSSKERELHFVREPRGLARKGAMGFEG